METQNKYLYLVLSKDFGLSFCTTAHASEAGAQAQIDKLGYGGLYVSRYHWDADMNIGMRVRLGGVSTSFDSGYTSPTVRDESHDANWGRLVEVMP